MAATPGNALNQNSTTAGLYTWDGTATTSSTAITQYNVLSGASSTTVNNIAPSTSGFVLTSNGASAQPTFQAPVYTQVPWTDKNSSFAAAAGNGYFVTATATATMPGSPTQGQIIQFIVDSASGILTIQANTGQIIRIGRAVSAAAGTAVSNFQGDSVTLVYRTSDTGWFATDCIGTFTVT